MSDAGIEQLLVLVSADGPEVAALSAGCAAVSSGSPPVFGPVASEFVRPPPARPPIVASWGGTSDDDAASRWRATEMAAGRGGSASGQGRSIGDGTAATSGRSDGGDPGTPEPYRPPTEATGSGHQAEGARADSGPIPAPVDGRGSTGTRDDGDPPGEERGEGSPGVEVHSSSAEDSVDENSMVTHDIRATGQEGQRSQKQARGRQR